MQEDEMSSIQKGSVVFHTKRNASTDNSQFISKAGRRVLFPAFAAAGAGRGSSTHAAKTQAYGTPLEAVQVKGKFNRSGRQSPASPEDAMVPNRKGRAVFFAGGQQREPALSSEQSIAEQTPTVAFQAVGNGRNTSQSSMDKMVSSEHDYDDYAPRRPEKRARVFFKDELQQHHSQRMITEDDDGDPVQ